MISILIDGLAVIIGGFIGITMKKHISDEHFQSLFTILGILVLVIGFQGVIPSDHMMIIMISLFIGSVIGVGLKLHTRIEILSKKQSSDDKPSFLNGAIIIFMFQCIGALALLGPLKAGLAGDYELMYFKAALDFISSLVFATIYDKSIFLSAVMLLIYEGGLFILSTFIEPILTPIVIEQISQIGSIILIGLGIEQLGIKQIKTVNYTPAMFVPIVISLVKGMM